MKRALLLLAIASATARAAPDPKATPMYHEGEKLYAAGNYLGAAEKFRAAYELDHDPVYLFNLAQAYRFGENCEESAKYYREFLAKVPTAPNAAKVQIWLDEQEACAIRARATQRAVVVKTAEPEAHRGRLIAGIATGVVGLGLVGFGVVEFGKVGSIADRRDAAQLGCTVDKTCTDTSLAVYDELAHTKQLRGGIALGLAGAAIGTALILILGSGSDESPVSAAPTAGGGMVYGSWTF